MRTQRNHSIESTLDSKPKRSARIVSSTAKVLRVLHDAIMTSTTPVVRIGKLYRRIDDSEYNPTLNYFDGYTVPEDEIHVFVKIKALADSAGVGTSATRSILRALENNCALIDGIRYNYGIEYTCGYKNKSEDKFVFLDHALHEIESLSTLQPNCEKSQLLEMLRELRILIKLFNSSLEQRADFQKRLRIYREEYLAERLQHLAEVLPEFIDKCDHQNRDFVSKFCRKNVLLLRDVCTLLKEMNGFYGNNCAGTWNFSRNCSILANISNSCVLNHLSNKSHQSARATPLYSIYFFLKEYKERIEYKGVAHVRLVTFLNPHSKYRRAVKRIRPISAKPNPPKNLRSIVGDFQNAFADVFQNRTAYLFLNKKNIPQYFLEGFEACLIVRRDCLAKYKTCPTLRECFAQAFAYYHATHRKYLGVPPPNWISRYDFKIQFEHLTRASSHFLSWKRKNPQNRDGTDTTEYENFLLWCEVAQKACDSSNMPDPIKVGGRALRNYNLWALWKSWGVYSRKLEWFHHKYGLQMSAYSYLLANIKELKRRHRLTYEDLRKENCFLIATNYVVANRRFDYTDSSHKPEWIINGDRPPGLVGSKPH